MKEFRAVVIKKFLEGERPGAIFKSLQNLGVKRDFVYRTIRRYRETSSLDDRKRSGRRRSARTERVIKTVRERVRRKSQRSVRKMAADLNVSKSTMHNVLKQDLGCQAFKKRKVHGVSEPSKKKRLERATLLLSRHAGRDFVFSDEKLFVLQQSHNVQNDRLWACRSRDIPDRDRNIPRFQSAASVMVWGGICKRGKLPLVFIEKGVKINALYYKMEVLQNVVKPSLERMYGKDDYVFQQDGAPSHTANLVQNWCRANLTDFLAKDEWPPSSPDLNPLDYFVWSYMLSKINEHKVSTLVQFKAVILRIWDEMPMEVVRAACDGFEKRLKLVKKVKGGVIPKHML